MMRGLVEEFWDALHPMPDEEGVATRVAALTGLNGSGKGGTLIAPIARVPLTSPTSVREVATWDWKRSTAAGTQPDSHSKAGSDGEQLTIQTILESSARETPDEFFRATIAEVDGALEELQALGAALEQRCGGASPPGYAIQEALSEARLALGSLSADRVLSEVDSAPGAPNGESPVEAATLDRAAPTSDGVSRREDAFRQMLALADFFRRTEPHSPIPFLLERAVRWGKMPLPGLLLELIPDGAARETYAKLTGVPGGPSDGSQG